MQRKKIVTNREKLKGKISFSFSVAEKAVFKKRKKIKVSDWARLHRIVTAGPLTGANWDNSLTPYSKGIMNASFFPSVEELIVCKAPQTGITQAVNTCIAYAIDRKPGPVMFVYPKQKDAEDAMKDNVIPMIKKSKRLSSYTTGSPDDLAKQRINLKHLNIYAGWSGSASSLASKSIMYAVADEIDKFEATAGKKETSPLNLLRKRQITFPYSRKLWIISTPTMESAQIWILLNNETDVIFYYFAKCPFCSKMQIMEFDSIKFPKEERDPKVIKRKKLAWYECIKCGKKWTDETRNKAVQEGKWKTEDKKDMYTYLKEERPQSIGFYLPAWYSFFVSLSECASKFLSGLKDKNELKDFMNAIKAEPWVDYSVTRKEDKILALKSNYPEGIVPANGKISCLTATADTQDNGFYYTVRAWEYGLELESYLIRYGFVETKDALINAIFGTKYKDIEGLEYFVRIGIIDAMGHRTAEIYDLCRKYRGRLIPFQGVHRQTQKHKFSNQEFYPGTNKPIPGGIQLLRSDVNFYKNSLASKLEISKNDAGSFHLHSDTEEEYARQMCAEYLDEKGLWQCPKGKDNHYWDCEAMQLLAVDMLGVRYWEKQETQKKKEQKEKTENPFTAGIERIFGNE